MRGLRRAVPVLAIGLTMVLSACEFDGAYDLPLPGSKVDEDNSFEVTAEFRDVLNVVPRSPVMVDDVPVGEITDVERVGWSAKVTMRIRKDVKLPDDATAEIRQTSLLGEKYVALEGAEGKDSAERLGEGDHIPLAATGRNPEVEEVLGALSFLLSGGGVGQLATISTELNEVMSGRTGRLTQLLHDLDNVVGTIDDQKADIIRAMESLNGLASTLNKEKGAISGALDVMGPAIGILADQHDDLMAMLRALDQLGVVGTRVIRASRADLLSILRDLEPVLDQLGDAGDSLAGGLSLLLSFPFPEAAQEIVKGDYANTEIKMDINFENYIGTEPVVPLPPPGEVLDDLRKCLASGSLTSKACAAFLTNLDLLKQLKARCAKPAYKANPVCRALQPLGPGSQPDLPGLPDLPLLSGLASTPSTGDLFGAGLT